jgi:Ca2+-dependent lipid-binding protein
MDKSYYVNSPNQGIIGNLKILVLKAVLYKDVRLFFTMSPYFIARLSPSKVFKSSVRSKEGKFPMWNEIFYFTLDDSDVSLNISVFDNSKYVND